MLQWELKTPLVNQKSLLTSKLLMTFNTKSRPGTNPVQRFLGLQKLQGLSWVLRKYFRQPENCPLRGLAFPTKTKKKRFLKWERKLFIMNEEIFKFCYCCFKKMKIASYWKHCENKFKKWLNQYIKIYRTTGNINFCLS